MLIFTLLSFKAFKYFGLNISIYIQYLVYVSLLCSVLSTFRLYCIIFITSHLCSCWILYPYTCALVGSYYILDANTSCISHQLCVGHAIDLCVALNCIVCPNDHLLAKGLLQSFFYDCSCLIKICLIVYILFITLIVLYLLIYLPCIQLVISLMKVLFVCECFRLQVYMCKCFTASRLGMSEFHHYFQTHV